MPSLQARIEGSEPLRAADEFGDAKCEVQAVSGADLWLRHERVLPASEFFRRDVRALQTESVESALEILHAAQDAMYEAERLARSPALKQIERTIRDAGASFGIQILFEQIRSAVRGILHPREGAEPNSRSALQHIREAIESSRFIYSLEAGLDGEGTEAYEKATWERATEFLSNLARWIFEKHDIIIDAPDIGPGPDGSIDLHWKTERYELLVNVPKDPASEASFYGDDYGKSTIKGTFKLSAFNTGLMMWLTSRD